MKKLVIYGVGCGLGNRLLTIASALAYAKKTDRKLEMIWHTGGTATIRKLSHCECKFEKLFNNDFFLKDVEDYKFYIKESEVSYEEFCTGNMWKRRFRGKNIEYVGDEHDVEFYNVNCVKNVHPPCDQCADIGFELNQENNNIAKYTKEIHEALNLLTPKSEILKRVITLDDNTIGVHIRRTDFVGNTTDGRPQVNLSIYEDIIFKEIQSGKKIYLCSDDGKLKQKLKKQYEDKIHIYDFGYTENFSSVRVEQGVMDALVEILTLKNTSKIYHTKTSSFAYLPAVWGNIELISLK